MLINPYSDSQIEDQIKVLNEDYSKSGLTWTLKNTTRTTKADWFDNAGPESYECFPTVRAVLVITNFLYQISADRDEGRVKARR